MDIQYSFGFDLSLLVTNDEALRTIAVTKVREREAGAF